jgi:NitT/TauT family transport system ATP-binding protein
MIMSADNPSKLRIEASEPERLPATVLEVQHLSKSYPGADGPVTVLDDISLSVSENEIICIVGASGCGKTTLLKVMAGLLPYSAGEILLDGERVSGPMPRKTSVVFQEDALLPWYRVEDNIALGLAAQKVRRDRRRELVADGLRKVGLTAYAKAYPHQLSGGMRQRVALMRGLVMEPRLLLLDEPFAALDEQTRNLMGAELRELHHRVGGAMVMITHSLTEAVLLSDRVVALSSRPGRVQRIVDVPLGDDRPVSMVDSAQFVALRHLLWAEIQGDWMRSMERTEE